MKILFYFGHPAQYLFARATIKRLLSNPDFEIIILIKTKDVLENLLKSDRIPYQNILPQERGKSKFHIAWSLVKRNFKILPIILKNRPDLMIGTDASIAQLGRMLKIDCVSITEDDYEVIKTLGDLTYPFTHNILCPEVCDVGKWNDKKIGYKGYMKLGYLHPNVFTPNNSVKDKYNLPDNYVIIRLAKLTAHHDFGIKGINQKLLTQIIIMVEEKGLSPFISTEDVIYEDLRKFELVIDPSDMHDILSFSKLLICDSQSMSVESAMLGVPSIRYSDFAGRISVLEELEIKYGLTYGFKVGDENSIINKISELLELENLSKKFQTKRKRMLNDKIDVTEFLEWFICNYPDSQKIIKNKPDYQNRFIC
ncbi:DUF354 domain-containing protein [Salegentibacter sediminis]|uniref:DUF354 domain-containing protein n=1 Tax=Salegentibacter sediminis TaxID=1930251 RepID=UPI0009BFD1A4|nr:DUF354 domain-containing protein [Salegentibacter sediminis]